MFPGIHRIGQNGVFGPFPAVIIKVKNKADYGIAQVPGLASFERDPRGDDAGGESYRKFRKRVIR